MTSTTTSPSLTSTPSSSLTWSGGAALPAPNGATTTTCTATSLCELSNPAGHQIQWKYFVPELDANPNDPGINFARQTQPTISPALFNLPAEAIAGCADVADPVYNGTGDLIARDFARRRLQLRDTADLLRPRRGREGQTDARVRRTEHRRPDFHSSLMGHAELDPAHELPAESEPGQARSGDAEVQLRGSAG